MSMQRELVPAIAISIAAGSTWQWLQTKFQFHQLKNWHTWVLTAIAEVMLLR